MHTNNEYGTDNGTVKNDTKLILQKSNKQNKERHRYKL